LVATVLGAGITDSLLTQAGFNKADYDGAFANAVVDILGGGFTNAWLESVMTGQPMNVELAFTLSLGRLIAEQVPDGDELAARWGCSEVGVNTFGINEEYYSL
jgi:hypothetical protein